MIKYVLKNKDGFYLNTIEFSENSGHRLLVKDIGKALCFESKTEIYELGLEANKFFGETFKVVEIKETRKEKAK